MQKNVKLSILTPEKAFFNGEAAQIIIATPEGEMGVMADHMHNIAVVSAGILKIEENGVWRGAVVGQGIMDVSAVGIECFVDTAEWAEDIGAEKAPYSAEERTHGSLTHTEYLRTNTAVARAKPRLKTPEKKHH